MTERAHRTYGYKQPLQSHFRLASCQEVNCVDLRNGWSVRLAADMVDHINFIRSLKRYYTFTERTENGEVVFDFPPGAGPRCFKWKSHRVRNDRPPLFVVRGSYIETYQHERGEDWVEDFQGHLDKVREDFEQ